MSAITALSSFQAIDPQVLVALMQTMDHRSRSDASLLSHEYGGLCYRGEESFTEQEQLEHVDIFEGCLVAFDGYLFNAHQIKQSHLSLSQSLVLSYLKEGPSFLEKLDGHFVIAIYQVEKEELFIARDPFGVKPLYYVQGEFGLCFASEAGSFVRTSMVEPKLNLEVMPEFWNMGYVSGENCLFEGIKRVPVGGYMQMQKGNLIDKGRFLPKEVELSGFSQSHAEEVLEQILTDQLQVHLEQPENKEVFMPLTGQLEESIMAIKLKALNVDLKTASLAYGDFASADMRLRALQTQQYLQSDQIEQNFTDLDFWMQIPGTAAILDDLAVDERMLFKLKLIEHVPAETDIAFDAQGAEVLFADRYRYLTSGMDLLLKRNQNNKRGYTAGFKNLFKDPKVPDWRKKEPVSAFGSKLKAQQMDDLLYALPSASLILLDRIYTAYGWQLFVPFLSKRMQEFALGLDDALMVKNKQGRMLLRHLLSTKTNSIDSSRSLQPIILPIEAWLNDRRHHIGQYLARHAGIRQVFVMKELKDLFKRELSGEASRLVFSMLMFACWYDVYIEAKLPTPELFPEFHQLAQEVANQVEDYEVELEPED